MVNDVTECIDLRCISDKVWKRIKDKGYDKEKIIEAYVELQNGLNTLVNGGFSLYLDRDLQFSVGGCKAYNSVSVIVVRSVLRLSLRDGSGIVVDDEKPYEFIFKASTNDRSYFTYDVIGYYALVCLISVLEKLCCLDIKINDACLEVFKSLYEDNGRTLEDTIVLLMAEGYSAEEVINVIKRVIGNTTYKK